ncbi:MAG: hypothetical protein NE334_12030 [Lentisphaeraceae bacterium]|nr:hypothetical protein [Lentisphaeraceae bacterium]
MKKLVLLLVVMSLTSCLHRRAHRVAHRQAAHAHAHAAHSHEGHAEHQHENSDSGHTHESTTHHYKTGHVVKVLPARCVKRTIRGRVYFHDGRHWYSKRNNTYVVVVKP